MERNVRSSGRVRRHLRVRKRVHGTAVKPRLAVFRSLKHIYAQLIVDDEGRTLCAASTLDPAVRPQIETGGNVAAAKRVGELLAARALEIGVERCVFDRGGYDYHGRVAALADGARGGGLKF